MREALRRWRENYYVSQMLSTAGKPLERSFSAIGRRLRLHIARNGIEFPLPNGRTLRIGRDSGIAISTALHWGGLDAFEPATSRTLRYFFSRASVFVDVGANYGFYSMLAALWNPDIRGVAFEPVPQIFVRLQDNIRLNHLQDRVVAHRLALSDTSGNARLFVPTSSSRDCESTATLAQGGWQQRQGVPAIDVLSTTFDEFEREHPLKVDLVKIDVEDHEASVLRGMQDVIRRDRPIVVCEILERAHANESTREVVRSLGYTAYWITALGYVRVSGFDFERRDSQDFLLVPEPADGEVVANPEVFWSKRQATSAA